MRKVEFIRWVLVAPVAVFGFYLSFVLGIVSYSALNYICPKEQMVSGMCTASWYSPALDVLFILCPSIGAILVVAFSSYIAPKNKAQTSKFVYVVGSCIALYWAFISNNWWAFLGTVVAGLLTVLFISKQFSVKYA